MVWRVKRVWTMTATANRRENENESFASLLVCSLVWCLPAYLSSYSHWPIRASHRCPITRDASTHLLRGQLEIVIRLYTITIVIQTVIIIRILRSFRAYLLCFVQYSKYKCNRPSGFARFANLCTEKPNNNWNSLEWKCKAKNNDHEPLMFRPHYSCLRERANRLI